MNEILKKFVVECQQCRALFVTDASLGLEFQENDREIMGVYAPCHVCDQVQAVRIVHRLP